MTTTQEAAPSPFLVPSPALSSPQIPERLVARIANQSGSEKLNISQCNLDEIPLQAIRDHYEGTPLDLNISFNAISTVTSEFTLAFIYLTKLDISRNYLQNLPENFGLLRDLQYLDLRNNLLETLPLSMGRMNHLCFLNISENPLRSPLKDLLERGASEIPDLIKFFDQLSSSLCSTEVRSKSDKIQEIQIITLAVATDEQSTAFEVDHVDVQVKKNTTLRKALIMVIPWIITIMLMAGYFVETAYLDWLSEEYPYLKLAWMGYKPLHEASVMMTQWIPKGDSFILKPPPPTTMGLLDHIWISIWTELNNWRGFPK